MRDLTKLTDEELVALKHDLLDGAVDMTDEECDALADEFRRRGEAEEAKARELRHYVAGRQPN